MAAYHHVLAAARLLEADSQADLRIEPKRSHAREEMVADGVVGFRPNRVRGRADGDDVGHGALGREGGGGRVRVRRARRPLARPGDQRRADQRGEQR